MRPLPRCRLSSHITSRKVCLVDPNSRARERTNSVNHLISNENQLCFSVCTPTSSSSPFVVALVMAVFRADGLPPKVGCRSSRMADETVYNTDVTLQAAINNSGFISSLLHLCSASQRSRNRAGAFFSGTPTPFQPTAGSSFAVLRN